VLAVVADAYAREEASGRVEYPRGTVIEVTEAEFADEQVRRYPRLASPQPETWEEGGEADGSIDLMDATADAMLAQMDSQRFREGVGRDLIGVRAAARTREGGEVDLAVGDAVREFFGFEGDEF